MARWRWQGWRKMKERETPAAEALLKLNERWCMNACSRYISRESLRGEVWALDGEDGAFSALIVHARQGVLPVLRGRENIPAPHFLRGLFGPIPVHSLQGRKSDVLAVEAKMEKLGLFAVEKNDFDLMCIDKSPSVFGLGLPKGLPSGLKTRKPHAGDMDSLVALHAAYEKEEVLSAGRKLNPAASRLHMEKIFATEQMLVAELGGRLVGKINTNAIAFTRYQVGGVYVHPDYRGLGIARRMAGEFVASLVAQGKGISLFVKKSNTAARRVYQGIGFETLGDYRINYYQRG